MLKRTMALACLAFIAAGVWAIDTEIAFEDPVLQARYQALINETRCLVCQNQTIADSNAPLAADLRREIREMIAGGSTDREIMDFLVARYGDFVLYRPPLQPTTWALWGGPLLLLAVGAIVFVRILQSRAGQSFEEEEGA